MPSLSSADHHSSPPTVIVPRDYNAAHDLIERNLIAGRSAKIACIDAAGRYTYGQLAERVNRAADTLAGIGLGMEERVMLCHLDTVDWPSVFLGAIKAGIVPVAVNTLLTTSDYEFMLRDSRARALYLLPTQARAFPGGALSRESATTSSGSVPALGSCSMGSPIILGHAAIGLAFSKLCIIMHAFQRSKQYSACHLALPSSNRLAPVQPHGPRTRALGCCACWASGCAKRARGAA